MKNLNAMEWRGKPKNCRQTICMIKCKTQSDAELDVIKSNLGKLTAGVPQGSILGPFLFLVYMNDFNSSSDKFHLINYTDDATLCLTH